MFQSQNGADKRQKMDESSETFVVFSTPAPYPPYSSCSCLEMFCRVKCTRNDWWSHIRKLKREVGKLRGKFKRWK